jgi:hypothetical protein
VKYESVLRLARCWLVRTLLAVLLAFAAPLTAQITGTIGQPLISKGGTNAGTDPAGTTVDAFVFTGTGNICTRINAAWASVLAAGFNSGTIDARGFTGNGTGTASCGTTNPFPAGAHGKLLLGNIVVSTNATWVVPEGVTIVVHPARTGQGS